MQIQKLCSEVADLLEQASMMGHHDQKLLRSTLVDALAADTGISRSDVDALLLIHAANRKAEISREIGAAEGSAKGANILPFASLQSDVVER